MKYHFTLTRVARIKKMENNKCWRGCAETGTLVSSALSVGMQSGTAMVEKTAWFQQSLENTVVPLKTKPRITVIPQLYLGVYTTATESRHLNRYLHPCS